MLSTACGVTLVVPVRPLLPDQPVLIEVRVLGTKLESAFFSLIELVPEAKGPFPDVAGIASACTAAARSTCTGRESSLWSNRCCWHMASRNHRFHWL